MAFHCLQLASTALSGRHGNFRHAVRCLELLGFPLSDGSCTNPAWLTVRSKMVLVAKSQDWHSWWTGAVSAPGRLLCQCWPKGHPEDPRGPPADPREPPADHQRTLEGLRGSPADARGVPAHPWGYIYYIKKFNLVAYTNKFNHLTTSFWYTMQIYLKPERTKIFRLYGSWRWCMPRIT